MPSLYILAGANGSGKTTYYNTAVEQGFIDSSLPFIDIDLIAQNLGGYTQENFAKADGIARQQIADLISRRASFMIESNLARTSDYDWIKKMAHKGYDVILYFLGTDDIDINKNRIKKRVKEGGHDIAESIIEHRYRVGLTYLKSEILIFKEAYLIDNSLDTPKEMAAVKNGQIIQKSTHSPSWVTDVLFIVMKLQDRKSK